ncbi:minor tail protein [Mycobacterium phage Rahalelujah]|nr:minor tail protein [Mycobacterium phage Rahalelujah]
MAVWPTNPLDALDGGGAFEIGGGGFGFGQEYTETIVKNLFSMPTPTAGNAIDMLRSNLLKLPLDALKGFKDLLPPEIGGVWDTVEGAVDAIMSALTDNPLFMKLGEFQEFLSGSFATVQTVVQQIIDILGGFLVTPINAGVQAVKDWWTSVQGKTSGLNGSGQLDVSKLLGDISMGNIDGLGEALEGAVTDAEKAIRDALTGIVDATPTDLDDWILKLLTPASDIVQNLPIPNVGGLPNALNALSTGVADIKNAINNIWAAVPTPVIPQDPNTTTYDTVGTHTFTVPEWMLPGDKIQLIGVGGGHNAPLAFSGKAGQWAVAQVVVGTGGITAGSTLTVTVGAGGARNTAEREGTDSTVTFGGSPLLVATRGQEPNVGIGAGPGDQVYDGITYYGGAAQIITAADGNAPGGGGCGGPYGFFGGGGARGQVWIRVVQTITSGTLIDLAARVSGILPITNGGTGANTAAQALSNLGGQPLLPSGTTSQFLRGDKTMAVVTKANVGLGNVDNTSDLNKPISTATQTALNDRPTTAAVLGYAQPLSQAVTGSKNGTLSALTLWTGTAAQYAAIGTKDPNTIYVTT